MKRDELKALGLTDEQVESVMQDYGKSIYALQRAADEKSAALQKAADEKDAELKKYLKGGELYTDPAEIQRLKTFEKDTLTKETNAKKTAGLIKLFKSANASDSVAKLFVSGKNLDEIELDEQGDIKGGEEILKQAQADYSDLFGNGNSGVPQGTTAQTKGDTAKKTPFYI